MELLRRWGKAAADGRQEAITAYLDNALTPAERQRFERQLAAEPALRADLERQRWVKDNPRQLPRMRAPRSFTLDPKLYARPAPASRSLYPAMRAATALVAVLFVAVLVFDFGRGPMAGQPQAAVSMVEEAAVEAPAAPVEVTRVVTASDSATAEVKQEAPQESAAPEPTAAAAVAGEAVNGAPAGTQVPAPAAGQPVLGLQDPLTATLALTDAAGAGEAELAADAARTAVTATQVLTEAGAAYAATAAPAGDAVALNQAAPTATPVAGLIAGQPPLSPDRSFFSPLRLAEFALGGLAVVLLALTLYLRRG